MREFFFWLESVQLEPNDLFAIIIAPVILVFSSYRLAKLVRCEIRRRTRRSSNIEYWFIRGTYRRNRDELGIDHPLTQELGIETLKHWRERHPKRLRADRHGDRFIRGVMEDLHPVSGMRM